MLGLGLHKETKWLRFIVVEQRPKTVVMEVINMSEQTLGRILWRNGWRQYVYETTGEYITFNDPCLQDIADVLTTLNEEHKKSKES